MKTNILLLRFKVVHWLILYHPLTPTRATKQAVQTTQRLLTQEQSQEAILLLQFKLVHLQFI